MNRTASEPNQTEPWSLQVCPRIREIRRLNKKENALLMPKDGMREAKVLNPLSRAPQEGKK